MNEGACCAGPFWTRFLAKLGRCPKCLRLSLAAALCSWGAVAIAALAPADALVIGLLAVLASAFTTLAIGHVLAFLWRWRRVIVLSPFDRENHENVERPEPTITLDRRRFLVRSTGMAVGALFALVLGRRAEAAPLFGLYCLYEAQNSCPPIIQGDRVCIPCFGSQYPGTGEGSTPAHPSGRLGSERQAVIDPGPYMSVCVLRLKLDSTFCLTCLGGKILIPAPPAPPPFNGAAG